MPIDPKDVTTPDDIADVGIQRAMAIEAAEGAAPAPDMQPATRRERAPRPEPKAQRDVKPDKPEDDPLASFLAKIADDDPDDEEETEPEVDPDGKEDDEESVDVGSEKITPTELKRLRKLERDRELEEARQDERAKILAGQKKPEDEGPKGAPVDPIKDPERWQAIRERELRAWAKANGRQVTAEQVEEAAIRDLERAQIVVEREENQKLRAELETERQEARAQKEAQALQDTLTPLFKKYRLADDEDGRREVADAIIAAAHRGEEVNYEKLVERAHKRAETTIRRYFAIKRDLASKTRRVSGKPGHPRAPISVVDSLPADLESFDKLGDLAERQARGGR